MNQPPKAGRELDALVAAEVMDLDPVEWSGDDLVWGDQKSGGIVPRYSSDISSAWLVIEGMHGDGATVDPKWTEWVRQFANIRLIQMDAREAAHAISLAALKAVGAGVLP